MLAIVLASVIFAIGGLMMSFAEGFTRLAPSLGVAVSFVLGSFLLSKAVQAEGLTIPYILGLGIESVATGCVHQRAECVRMCTQTTGDRPAERCRWVVAVCSVATLPVAYTPRHETECGNSWRWGDG
jgi:membrane-bound ClpP family serine protease